MNLRIQTGQALTLTTDNCLAISISTRLHLMHHDNVLLLSIILKAMLMSYCKEYIIASIWPWKEICLHSPPSFPPGYLKKKQEKRRGGGRNPLLPLECLIFLLLVQLADLLFSLRLHVGLKTVKMVNSTNENQKVASLTTEG